MRVEDAQLKAFILDGNLVEESALEKAAAEAKKTKGSLAEILVEKKFISEEELEKLEAYIVGVPFVDLSKTTVPREVLDLIPEPIAVPPPATRLFMAAIVRL